MIAVVGLLVWQGTQDIIDKVEAKTFIAVEFKNSPVLTADRQKYIRRDLTSFHDYLEAIGFEIPKKVPFVLGTTPGIESQDESMSTGTPYDTATNIPQHDITKDDIIQATYARFVFHNLMSQYESSLAVILYHQFIDIFELLCLKLSARKPL